MQKTLFWLFKAYRDAKTAVEHLLNAGLGDEEINVVVAEAVARDHMTIDQEAGKSNRDRQAERPELNLDVILVGQQPVEVPDLGPVYAAGELATILAKTASSGQGLESTLTEFSLPPEAAQTYRQGVDEGGVLVFVRASRGTAAQASRLLREKENPPLAAEAV